MSQLYLTCESFNATLSLDFLLAGTDDVHKSLGELTTSTFKSDEWVKSFTSSTKETERLLSEQRHALQSMEAAVTRTKRRSHQELLSDSNYYELILPP